MAKTGGGAWTLTGANTYSGATTVSAGTLTLSGADGSIGSSAVTIAGGTLTVSNTGAANNGDRLSDSSAFTMNGGTFNYNNDASANDFSESAGTLTLIGGANTVAIQQAAVARTSTLTFAGLSRTAGALNFSGAGLGAAVDPRSQITFTSAPALSNGIIGPWATVNGTTYATLIGNDVVAYSGALTDVTRQSSGDQGDSRLRDDRCADHRGHGRLARQPHPGGGHHHRSTRCCNPLPAAPAPPRSTSPAVRPCGWTPSTPFPLPAALTLGTAVNTGTLTPATAGGNLLLVNSSTANNIATPTTT